MDIDTTPEIINAYQVNKTMDEFVEKVDGRVFSAEQVWLLIDQIYDVAGIKQLDFKDLY